LNTKTVCDIAHPFNTHIASDSRRSRVQRLLEGAAKGDSAKILIVIVAGLPLLPIIVPLERRILYHSYRCKLLATLTARHEGCQVDKWLKDRPWLPLRLENAVELRLLITPTAHHRLYFTRLRSEYNNCALEIVLLSLSAQSRMGSL